MTTPLLSVEGLTLSYGRLKAVDSASFSLGPGEVLGLCGHNGAGKSSVVRMLSGLIAPDAGRIVIDGEARSFSSVRDAQTQGVALVDQELSVIPALTVAENLALGEPGLGIGGRISDGEARARLDAVGLGGLDPARYLEDLTIGQRQLVEIARAMGRKARLFILDEPTATLNSADIEHVFSAIRAVTARGCSVIYVSHRLDEVLALCDRIVVMRDGAVVAALPIAEVSGERLVTLMLGHVPEQPTAQAVPASAGRPVLQMESLDAGAVLRGFSMTANAGTVTALAGQVGSGAADVLRALAGLAPEARGRVTVEGSPLPLGDPRRSLAAGIGYVSGDRKGEGLFLSRSIAENLVSTRLPDIARAGLLTPSWLKAQAARIARSVGVDVTRLPEAVSRLSGGNQQKVFLGRCLERDDLRVVLLDEPTRGVDVGGRADIHAIIRAIAARGVVVLFASSDLDEVLGVADDIVVMRGGRLVSRRPRVETDSARLLSDMTHSKGQEAA
ncbi:MAG: sugar ABC transporter ATP-binding protein [Rhizobiaceae bacterium]|nr:sugar ABC transporter ATP-binding protein [Rhizobiaceae bacterium]